MHSAQLTAFSQVKEPQFFSFTIRRRFGDEQILYSLFWPIFFSELRNLVHSSHPVAILRSKESANQTTFFFRIFARLGLLAVTFSVAAFVDAPTLAFACLLASIAFLRFSGNPLFFAALILALVNDFADRGVFIVKPYFFLYSFGLMP